MKSKPIYWKMLDFITGLKLYSIGLPLIYGLLLSTLLIETTNCSITLGTFLGFFPGFILFTVSTFPIWFIRQSINPSSFQRWCRNYTIKLAKFTRPIQGGLAQISLKDIRFFQYYLSHPANPENIWADQVDTTKFDWQNPKEWPF